MQQLPAIFPDVHFQLVNKTTNEGKGAAVRGRLEQGHRRSPPHPGCRLRIRPRDYPKLLQPILDGKADASSAAASSASPTASCTSGTRSPTTSSPGSPNALTNLNLTDMEVCYKVFTREVYTKIQIKSPRFGIEPELTAKVAKMRIGEGGRRKEGRRVRVYEVGVAYAGRTYEEGKKDWLERRRLRHRPNHPLPLQRLNSPAKPCHRQSCQNVQPGQPSLDYPPRFATICS